MYRPAFPQIYWNADLTFSEQKRNWPRQPRALGKPRRNTFLALRSWVRRDAKPRSFTI